ncbi:MAG: hypothetical protein RBU37_01485 [Myxococcota bacterium]|nr:hypothetical protein [Myxococcota bacterium]
MSKFTLITGLLVVSAAVLLSGCKSDCEKLVAQLEECSDRDKPTDKERAEFIEKCEKNKDKEPYSEWLPCAAKGGCDDFKACMEEAEKKREEAFKKKMMEEDLAEIQKAIDEKKFGETPMGCYGLDRDDVAEEIKAKCAEFSQQVITALTTEITTLRDEGKEDSEMWTKCYNLEEAAKKVSEEDGKKAKQLCEEAKAAADMKKTMELAQKNIDNKIIDFPWECDNTVEALEKIVSDWSKEKVAEVAKKCYLELGTIIMADKVPGMKYSCSYPLEKIIKGAVKWNLSSPEFDALREQAKPLCEP